MALDFGKVKTSVSLDRTGAFPLDKKSYFESYDAAVAAAATAIEPGLTATSSSYYFGQIITVNEGGEAKGYIIQPGGTLKPLGEDSGIKLNPDDLQINKENQVEFADRSVDPQKFVGKGYKILRQNYEAISIIPEDAIRVHVVSNISRKNMLLPFNEIPENNRWLAGIELNLTDNKIYGWSRYGGGTEWRYYTDWISYRDPIDNFILNGNPIENKVYTSYYGDYIFKNGKFEEYISDNTENVAILKQIDFKESLIYEIRYDFNLGGRYIDIPDNSTLIFNGGKLSNGEIYGKNIKIINYASNNIIFDNVITIGNYIGDIFDTNFSNLSDDDLISSLLHFSNSRFTSKRILYIKRPETDYIYRSSKRDRLRWLDSGFELDGADSTFYFDDSERWSGGLYRGNMYDNKNIISIKNLTVISSREGASIDSAGGASFFNCLGKPYPGLCTFNLDNVKCFLNRGIIGLASSDCILRININNCDLNSKYYFIYEGVNKSQSVVDETNRTIIKCVNSHLYSETRSWSFSNVHNEPLLLFTDCTGTFGYEVTQKSIAKYKNCTITNFTILDKDKVTLYFDNCNLYYDTGHTFILPCNSFYMDNSIIRCESSLKIRYTNICDVQNSKTITAHKGFQDMSISFESDNYKTLHLFNNEFNTPILINTDINVSESTKYNNSYLRGLIDRDSFLSNKNPIKYYGGFITQQDCYNISNYNHLLPNIKYKSLETNKLLTSITYYYPKHAGINMHIADYFSKQPVITSDKKCTLYFNARKICDVIVTASEQEPINDYKIFSDKIRDALNKNPDFIEQFSRCETTQEGSYKIKFNNFHSFENPIKGKTYLQIDNYDNKNTLQIRGVTSLNLLMCGNTPFYLDRGTTEQRDNILFIYNISYPESCPDTGFKFFNTDTNTFNIWDGNIWLNEDGTPADASKEGSFANKPLGSIGIKIGFPYYCTDKKNKQDGTGLMIYYKGNDVWIDGSGEVVDENYPGSKWDIIDK